VGKSGLALVLFLIGARTDRGVVGVSDERIAQVIAEFAFRGHLPTSAKEGWGVAELLAAILGAIDWTRMPVITSSALFAAAKSFRLRSSRSRGCSWLGRIDQPAVMTAGPPSGSARLRRRARWPVGAVSASRTAWAGGGMCASRYRPGAVRAGASRSVGWGEHAERAGGGQHDADRERGLGPSLHRSVLDSAEAVRSAVIVAG
jgi:hypothetical protein